eukprot:COSAG04_NODE_2789_length_3573_cov_3.378526_3_plen_93_part_00
MIVSTLIGVVSSRWRRSSLPSMVLVSMCQLNTLGASGRYEHCPTICFSCHSLQNAMLVRICICHDAIAMYAVRRRTTSTATGSSAARSSGAS